MDQSTCPSWCANEFPHRVNHHRSVTEIDADHGHRVAVTLHQTTDLDAEVVVFVHDRSHEVVASAAYTPDQVTALSRAMALLDHAGLIDLGARFGAAAVIAEGAAS